DNGCPYLITLVVDEYPATPDETIEETVCEGDTFTYEGEEYAAGTYEFPQTDDNGCPYLITLVVDEFDPASVEAGDDETICEGEEVTLTATGDGTFMWFVDGSDDMIGMEASLTVAPETSTTYRVKVTTQDGCEAEDTVTVTITEKVLIGDFVWEDANNNGVQDEGESGVFGVTVSLYQCVDDVNDGGVFVESMITNRFGLYQFEVCPNSGSYYIVFSDIPDGFEFTSQDSESDDSVDSDADAGGVTDCFEIFEDDDMTRDAGIKQSRQLFIGNKVRFRDPANTYVRRNADTACLGEQLFFWIHLEEEDLNDVSRLGNGLEGYVFTWNFPNGRTFVTSDDDCSECTNSSKEQAFEIPIDEDDFGLYTIDWSAPDGASGTITFDLSLSGECLEDGTRPSGVDSRITQISPNPATSGGSVNIAINTRNGSITTAETGVFFSARTGRQKSATVNIALYDMSGRIIAFARPYNVYPGSDVVNYQLGSLETGTYLIQVIGDGWKDTAKLIVK
ncbi:SdrD B-like domain-containing protein, partial [Croceivirga thetidis]